MLLPEAAQYIRDCVPTASVLALYGYRPDSRGFMPCPFHRDSQASLKIYDFNSSSAGRGWYCFGCHAGGSVLDFVMKHDSCSFPTAVRAVDGHLSLGLLSVEDWQTQERYRRIQSLLDEAEAVLLKGADVEQSLTESALKINTDAWREASRIPKAARSADDWTRGLVLREELDYLEYRLTKIDEFRKEVRAWRNGHRLLNSLKNPMKRPRRDIRQNPR